MLGSCGLIRKTGHAHSHRKHNARFMGARMHSRLALAVCATHPTCEPATHCIPQGNLLSGVCSSCRHSIKHRDSVRGGSQPRSGINLGNKTPGRSSCPASQQPGFCLSGGTSTILQELVKTSPAALLLPTPQT